MVVIRWGAGGGGEIDSAAVGIGVLGDGKSRDGMERWDRGGFGEVVLGFL